MDSKRLSTDLTANRPLPASSPAAISRGESNRDAESRKRRRVPEQKESSDPGEDAAEKIEHKIDDLA